MRRKIGQSLGWKPRSVPALFEFHRADSRRWETRVWSRSATYSVIIRAGMRTGQSFRNSPTCLRTNQSACAAWWRRRK